MRKLTEEKALMLDGNPQGKMLEVVEKMDVKKSRPLWKVNPHAWWVEITRGCNLKCQFCATRLFERGDFKFMEMDTWVAMLDVVQELTPETRIEFGNAGEPTLNPNLLEMLSVARKKCPKAQILTYTNGTQLVNGNLTYKELFEAGLNVAFVDMYASFRVHKEIAEKSGYEWVREGEAGKNPFQYQKDPGWNYIFFGGQSIQLVKKEACSRKASDVLQRLGLASRIEIRNGSRDRSAAEKVRFAVQVRQRELRWNIRVLLL